MSMPISKTVFCLTVAVPFDAEAIWRRERATLIASTFTFTFGS